MVSGELRGHRDGQNRGQRVAPPARAAELRHGAKTLPKASQPVGRPRLGVALASPPRPVVERAKLLARIAHQRIDQDLLGPAVGDPGGRRAGLARKALGVAEHLPVRRSVARAGEAASIDERLGEQDQMAMRRAHVFAQPAKTQRQDPRSQVRHRAPGQDHEPCVVGNEVQAAKLLLGKPPDPPVPGLELERAGVPADQREPVLAQDRNVAKAASHQSPERQIVVSGHQRIPALAFVRARGGAHRDLAQSLRNRVEHRLRRRQRACAPVCRPQDGLSRGGDSSYASTT